MNPNILREHFTLWHFFIQKKGKMVRPRKKRYFCLYSENSNKHNKIIEKIDTVLNVYSFYVSYDKVVN